MGWFGDLQHNVCEWVCVYAFCFWKVVKANNYALNFCQMNMYSHNVISVIRSCSWCSICHDKFPAASQLCSFLPAPGPWSQHPPWWWDCQNSPLPLLPWLQAGNGWGILGWDLTACACSEKPELQIQRFWAAMKDTSRNGVKVLSHYWGIPPRNAEATGHSFQKRSLLLSHSLCQWLSWLHFWVRDLGRGGFSKQSGPKDTLPKMQIQQPDCP